jgi:L-arabonate dehydrase
MSTKKKLRSQGWFGPTELNLQPAGSRLMEDFYYAGGLPVVLRELLEARLLHGQALTVNGKSLAENVASAENFNRDVIYPYESPFKAEAGLAVLFGNLAPRGAIIKPASGSPQLMTHRGRAVVFESIEDFNARIDDEALDVDEHCILVLKNCGPRGYPGMPEVGNMKLPPKILRKGVRDMVRISDARMSGTAFGTVVLHVAPEAAAGGALAVAREGDMISLDVPNRSLVLEVSDEALAARMAEWRAPQGPSRGYSSLYVKHVLQADEGADFDFLKGGSGSDVVRESH